MWNKSVLFSIFCSMLILSSCSGVKKEAEYPTKFPGSDQPVYNGKAENIWGDDGSLSGKIFGEDDKENNGGAGIGVNHYLWRATLDTISFMPISSADPFGGVILTDWYSPANKPDERYKLNLYILTKQLRSDGVRVSVFKQKKSFSNEWETAPVSADTVTDVENTILTRARELRVAQQTTLLDE